MPPKRMKKKGKRNLCFEEEKEESPPPSPTAPAVEAMTPPNEAQAKTDETMEVDVVQVEQVGLNGDNGKVGENSCPAGSKQISVPIKIGENSDISAENIQDNQNNENKEDDDEENPIFQELQKSLEEIECNKFGNEGEESNDSAESNSFCSFSNGGFEFANRPSRTYAEAAELGPKSVYYMVCQVSEKSVVACKSNVKANDHWPFFMDVPDDLVTGHDQFERILQVGDELSISVYKWNESQKWLTSKREEVKQDTKFWLNQKTGLLPKQAEAIKITQITYGESHWEQPTLGLVYYVKRRVQNDPSSFVSAEVACCGLVTPAKFVKRQIEGIDLADIKIGMLVEVICTGLPQSALVETRYILPAGSPFKIGNEMIPVQEDPLGALVKVKPHKLVWPAYTSDGIPKIFPCSAELTKEHLAAAEHVVAAALQVQAQIEYDKMIDARFEGKAKSVDGKYFTLVFPAKTKQEVKKYAEVWDIETLVQAKKELGEKHFAQGVVTDTELHSETGDLEFSVTVKFNNVQERNKQDVFDEFEDFKNGGTAVVHPVLSKVCRDRIHCFRFNWPSQIAESDTLRGKVMSILLGRPMERGMNMKVEDFDDANDGLPEEDMALNESVRRLNGRQRMTAKLMLQKVGLVNQKAPPGTGKTLVAASIVNAMVEEMPEGKQLLTACANVPVVKLAMETKNVCGNQRLDEVGNMALFSGMAKQKYSKQVEELDGLILKGKIDSAEFMKKLSKKDQKSVLKYVELCEKAPKRANERAMGKLYNKVDKPKVRFMTMALASDLLIGDGNVSDAEILIVDEATQVQWANLVHIVARLTKLKALLLTGDKRQLGVYLEDLPQLFHVGYGLESVLEQVDISPGTNHVALTKMYRSHPMLVEFISYAGYEPHGEKLIPAIATEERALITGSHFLLPTQNCPAGLIHAFSTHRKDPTSDSLTDDHQTEVTVTLVRALIKIFGRDFAKQIVVLCMYSFQKEELDTVLGEEFGILCVTVDSYQAQEADVTIVVTTKSRRGCMNEGKESGMEFFKDDRRATVALSRARHAIFLIGDLIATSEGPVWKRFIEKAMSKTKVVKPHYVLDLLNGSIGRMEDGTLRGNNGDLMDNDFANEWQKAFGQVERQAAAEGFKFLPQAAPSFLPRRDQGQRPRKRGPDDRMLHYSGNPRRQKLNK